MAPRAAARLESLGFTQVFDYKAGKADWLSNGMPSEGRKADKPQAVDAVRRGVPTCRLTDPVIEARDRAQPVGWEQCIVVNGTDVVLGRIRAKVWDSDPQTLAEEVMEVGPTTIRPNSSLSEVAERMHKRGVEDILVTTSWGQLIGVLYRSDADRELISRQ